LLTVGARAGGTPTIGERQPPALRPLFEIRLGWPAGQPLPSLGPGPGRRPVTAFNEGWPAADGVKAFEPDSEWTQVRPRGGRSAGRRSRTIDGRGAGRPGRAGPGSGSGARVGSEPRRAMLTP
jgi:hypothetical protein